MQALPTLEAASQNQQVSFAGELTNRCGISYFSGLVASGIYGAFRGYQLTSKGMPFRLKLNSMLNHSMKLGANNGNMFAVLALYFVTIKRTIPKLAPIDINPDLNLIISGAAAGTLYKAARMYYLHHIHCIVVSILHYTCYSLDMTHINIYEM